MIKFVKETCNLVYLIMTIDVQYSEMFKVYIDVDVMDQIFCLSFVYSWP